jgi:hypothetical protein
VTQPPDHDDFFVGYLPMSRTLKHSTLVAAVALLSALLGAGYALASHTAGAGPGKFSFARAQGTLGVLTSAPTPMLWTLDESVPGGVRGTLLVRQGKFGLSAKTAQLNGKAVRIQGSVIERDGERMIELGQEPMPAADADLSADELARLRAQTRQALGEITVQGEIEDSKCYLGRMRPGDRRTHRACAQLCIQGGIPAVLVGSDASGQPTRYLLATHAGHSIDHDVLPFVAEPVRVQGQLVRLGNWLVIETDLEHVTRL